jgi:hypothetical protein
LVQFRLDETNPLRIERLVIALYRVTGQLRPDAVSGHSLQLPGKDNFWHELAEHARYGFDRAHGTGIEPGLENWLQWFSNQDQALDASYHARHDRTGRPFRPWCGIVEVLDGVQQPWELEVALRRLRKYFVANGTGRLTHNTHCDCRCCRTLFREELCILDEYFAARPERRGQIMAWLHSYVMMRRRTQPLQAQ